MIDFFDNLIGFAFICVAVTGAIFAIVGCAFALLVLVGGLYGFARRQFDPVPAERLAASETQRKEGVSHG